MNLQKFSPWNWFKSENRQSQEATAPAPVSAETPKGLSPFWQMHRELDRWMDNAMRQWGMPAMPEAFASMEGLLKPSVDISEREDEYRISLEVPGVDEKDVKLSIDEHRLLIEGEKRQESTSKEDRYQRVERVYGSFQRVLDLPVDAKVEDIEASFDKGVLTVKVPRDKQAKARRREIPIQGR
ncbi:Hsp20/alpha crystallin family protein [Pistricoccus aurantiacus]